MSKKMIMIALLIFAVYLAGALPLSWKLLCLLPLGIIQVMIGMENKDGNE